MRVRKMIDLYNCKFFFFFHIHLSMIGSIDRDYFEKKNPVHNRWIGRDTESRKEGEACRFALYEARISWHEIAATRENLRCLIMGRGRVDSQDEPRGEREKERTGAWRQVGSTSGPREWGPTRYFSLKQIVGQTAPPRISTSRNLVQPRTLHFSWPHSVAVPIRMPQS